MGRGAIVFTIILLGACASIDERVQRLTNAGKFDVALVELEDNGAGAIVSEKADPKALQARLLYRQAVEKQADLDVGASVAVGLARQAVERSQAALARCVWSDVLEALHRENLGRVAAIDALLVEVQFAISGSGSMSLRRIALERSAPLDEVLADSLLVRAALDVAKERLLQDISEAFAREQLPNANFRRDFLKDILLCGVAAKSAAGVDACVSSLAELQSAVSIPCAEIGRFARARNSLATEARLSSILAECDRRFISWAARCAVRPPAVADVNYALLEGLRLAIDLLPASLDAACAPILYSALLVRAQAIAADPTCAALAWCYIEAARPLCADTVAIDKLSQSVINALRAAEPLRASIAIDLGAKVDPQVFPLLYMGLRDAIGRNTRGNVDWTWVDSVYGKPNVVLKVDRGERFEAKVSDLVDQTSTYLSHYQNVPNPMKGYMESRLSSQKLSVSFAESNYNSAVNSHNIYPTEWSLISVNIAQTSYFRAVDDFNATVRAYNQTPDTISEAVNLPYTYRAGRIRSGFLMEGSVIVGGRPTVVNHQSVATDNVKIGTKYSDLYESNRRDDPIDIDLSGEAQIRRLMEVSDQWVNDLAVSLIEFPRTIRVQLAPSEIKIIGWLDNPLGPRAGAAVAAKVPDWIGKPGARFVYPKSDVAPPVVALSHPALAEAGDSVRANSLSATCEVSTSYAGGAPLGRGSGFLISGDGLILTCAHVLNGPKIKVRFAEGPHAGEYEAEIVRANDRCDVALVQVKGLVSKRWLVLAQLQTARGSEILVFGSPSLDDAGSIAHLAVTEGKIVSPLGEEWGQPRIVAEVAIASGSSGGPIVDATSGEVIGIVTAVTAPQFSEARAATASFCLGAPATLFGDWLGLRYSDLQPATKQVPTDLPAVNKPSQ